MPKRPKTRAAAPGAKQPRARPTPGDSDQGPLFCFKYVDRPGGPVAGFAPDEAHAGMLLTFICDMGGLTWTEIERQNSGGHRKHHDQELETVCAEARERANKQHYAERFGDTLFRFRLSGTQRLWGFRQGRTFHVIWWDPDHRVYPTGR